MKKMKKMVSIMTALAVCVVMTIASAVPAFAATPSKENVKYEGKGKVEVEFIGDVQWSSKVKVTVKDSKGHKYKVKITERDDDGIEFVVKKFKRGLKYRFTINGVKVYGSDKYGTVKGTFKIAKKAKSITAKKAKSIATKDARSGYNVTKIRDLEADKDTYRGTKVWEVSFEGKKSGVWYDYEYQIERSSGKILFSEEERD